MISFKIYGMHAILTVFYFEYILTRNTMSVKDAQMLFGFQKQLSMSRLIIIIIMQ